MVERWKSATIIRRCATVAAALALATAGAACGSSSEGSESSEGAGESGNEEGGGGQESGLPEGSGEEGENPEGGEGSDTTDTSSEGGDDFDTVQVELPDAGNWSVPDNASAFINGDLVKLDTFCRANFIQDPDSPNGPGTILISMASGLNAMEARIQPVVTDWEGVTTHTSGSPTGLLLFNDGSLPASQDGPQFKYAAAEGVGEWNIEITENTGVGGRVVGTFSGLLKLQAGEGPTDLVVDGGKFDCAY